MSEDKRKDEGKQNVDDPDFDPHEQVGPEGCAAAPGTTTFEPNAINAPPEGCGFSATDQVHEMFSVEPIDIMVDPADGLPRPVDVQEFTPAPPFTRLHVVCLGDDREYVEVFLEDTHGDRPEVHPLWRPVQPASIPGVGDVGPVLPLRGRFDDEGKERERRRFKPEQVVERWGRKVVQVVGRWLLVRPARVRCRHYQRQLFNLDGSPEGHNPFEEGGKIQFKYCTAVRSLGGAFMDLSGQAVYACDLRDPPHEPTVKRFLDAHDDEVLKSKRHLKMVGAFGMTADGYDVQDIEPEGIFQ